MSQSPFGSAEGNPYQSPATQAASASGADYTAAVTPRAIELLRGTRPWVRFLSIIGFITAGLMIVGGILASFFGLSQGQFEMVGAGAVYVVIAVLYLFGAIFLGRFASSITDLERLPSARGLEEALAAQKTFWRYTGMLVAVVFAIYAVLLGLGLVIGIAAALMG